MRRPSQLSAQSTMAGFCSRWMLPSLCWTLLSLVSAVLCSVGLYFSNWFEYETSNGTINSVSPYRLCLNETSLLSFSCNSYFTFDEILSPEWKAVTIIMGAGACLLVFTSLISLFAFCVHKFCNNCLICSLAILQCAGVLLFVIGVVVFPSGMGNNTATHPDLCGEDAGSYRLGQCTIGWAYITIIAGTCLGLIAVSISWTPLMWNRKYKNGSTYAL